MNKTKTRTGLSALFAVLLAIMIAVPAIFQSGANAAVNKKQPTKATLTSAKATSYNKVSLKWKKSKNITSYAVYYKASNSKKWVKIANVSSKKTGYTHKSSKKYPLKQGKTYQYRIRGYNKKAKGNKKWGKYSSVKKVKVPKKPAAKPTEAPKPTVKPTETPKPIVTPNPTATPKPTAVPKPTAAPKPTVTPIPKPTAIPKPTQIPQPTKPVQPAKPTATPIPKPTAVPQPTATPKPVKVSSITLNQTSLTMTSKGQTASLTATVSPANAANKNITWSSSDSSIATVNANGTVTAIANGTADITATAADGSGVSAKCSVTVKMANNIKTVTLEGGKSTDCYISPESVDSSIDLKQVVMKVNGDTSIIQINGQGYDNSSWCAFINFTALKSGELKIDAVYNGKIIKTWKIIIASDWQEYLGYVSWRHTVESKIWTDGMSLKDKMDTARDFIKTNYDYKNGSGAAVYVYNDKTLDCHSATEIMGDFAKDAGANVKYSNTTTGLYYDYFADSKAGRHTFNVIFIDGAWAPYDASPLP